MSDLKTIKLPVPLVERLSALSMAERVTVIERGLNLVSSTNELGPVEVAPAPAVAPVLVETVSVPEPAPVVAESAPASGQDSFAGFSAPDPAPPVWVDYTIKVPARASEVLDRLAPQERAALVDFTIAVVSDVEHARRIALLGARFMWTAWETSQLLEIFQSGTPRAPRLERRLRAALHGWASGALSSIGMQPKMPPLAKPAGITVAGRRGVPAHFELFGLWLPFRCAHELDVIQAKLVTDYAVPLEPSAALREACEDVSDEPELTQENGQGGPTP